MKNLRPIAEKTLSGLQFGQNDEKTGDSKRIEINNLGQYPPFCSVFEPSSQQGCGLWTFFRRSGP
ncbi:MAG: hypothetical protein U1D25_00330 [Hydrogenophaga sp.]|uniref:hypothetical protein n=1 Tax=Hydrogenophaga sp. TaxID=1904254 RepID=UPI002AB82DB6|nr:hypothetical protein [Hydrogenophaga sp.]MDZ4186546.1 hypothetical protein [Hydrogenophaga sp.]